MRCGLGTKMLVFVLQNLVYVQLLRRSADLRPPSGLSLRYGSLTCSHTFLWNDFWVLWGKLHRGWWWGGGFKYLGMIWNFLLMWIHWFCHRYVSNFPFDPIHIKTLNRASKAFVTPRRSAGRFLWQTHIFPNHPTFGLEITGQTNEFNELSQTQWMSLAIWTQIKGYGQVRRPFQGGLYTNVTESGRFSVCADKLFKVARMSATVPPSAPPPFCSPFCARCSFTRTPTRTKAADAKRSGDVTFASFLPPANARPRGRLVRVIIVEENKASTRPGTSSDGDSLLLPPFQRFAFLVLPPLSLHPFALLSTLSPLRALVLKAIWCLPAGFHLTGDFESERWHRHHRENGQIWGATARLPNEAAELSREWLRKKTPQSIWYVCVHLIESIGGPWETTKGGKS